MEDPEPTPMAGSPAAEATEAVRLELDARYLEQRLATWLATVAIRSTERETELDEAA